jgi:hypothetical protein
MDGIEGLTIIKLILLVVIVVHIKLMDEGRHGNYPKSNISSRNPLFLCFLLE